MSIPTTTRSTSSLDHPPVRLSHRPVDRDHDFESLQWLYNDDFGVVDVDPSGQAPVIREHTAALDCVATIVWKKTTSGWREACWHGSVNSSEIPDEPRELSENAA